MAQTRRRATRYPSFTQLQGAVKKRAVAELEASTERRVRVTSFERNALAQTLTEDRSVERELRRALQRLSDALDDIERVGRVAAEIDDFGGSHGIGQWAAFHGEDTVKQIRENMRIPWRAHVRPTTLLGMIVWMFYADRRDILGVKRLATYKEVALYAILSGYMPMLIVEGAQLAKLTDGAIIKRATNAVRNEAKAKGYLTTP